MHTNNVFRDRTNTQLVDRLIGRSYEVVKEVYLNLPLLKELYDSEAINFFYEHWDEVTELNNNISNIKIVGENMDAILAVPELLQEVQDEHKEAVTEITALFKSSTTVINNLRDTAVNTINQATQVDLNKLEELTEASSKTIKELRDDSISAIEKKAEDVTESFEARVEEVATGYINQINSEAGKAMFSYRYYSLENPIPYSDLSVNDVYPSVNLKVGDHLVDPDGRIFEVTSVSGSVLQVGKQITSIKGAKGDTGLPGVGLTLQGVYKTKEEFLEAGLVGESGDAYQIYDPENPSYQTVMIWNVNTGEWQDGGAIQGAQGESANEILMDPDPEEHFRKIYGQSTGDIIGALLINPEGMVIEPEPVVTFENNI